MNFLTAALESATETGVATVEVASTAMETIAPTTGVMGSMVDTVIENKSTITKVALVATAAYVTYKFVAKPLIKKYNAKSAKVATKKPSATLTQPEIYLMKTMREKWASMKNIAFNPEWHNGTGYFNNLTKAEFEGVAANEFVATSDENDRKIVIFVVQPGMNIVFFERYSSDEVKKYKKYIIQKNIHDSLGLNIQNIDGEVLDRFFNKELI